MFLEYIALCFFSSPKQFQWKLKITCLDLSSVQDQARSIIEVKKSFRYLKIAIWITFSNIPTRKHWSFWTNKVHTPTFIQMYRWLLKDFNFSPFFRLLDFFYLPVLIFTVLSASVNIDSTVFGYDSILLCLSFYHTKYSSGFPGKWIPS